MFYRAAFIAGLLLFSVGSFAVQKITAVSVLTQQEKLRKNTELYLAEMKQRPFTENVIKQAESLTRKALKPFGYYSADVIVIAKQTGETVTLEVTIHEGQQTTIQQLDIEISGAARNHEEFNARLSKITLNKGEPLNHTEYEAAKTIINSALFDLGYFDAKWIEHTLAVRQDSHSATIKLHIDSGKRFRYGPVHIAEDVRENELIHRLNPMVIGHPYDNQTVSDFNITLTNMPYFKSVRVYPDIANRDNDEVPIIVQVLHKPNNSFEVGGGVSTDDNGLKLRFKWTKPWITDAGHYLETNIEASKIDPQARISYTIPVEDPNNDVWRFGAGYINDDIRRSAKITTQIQRQWLTSKKWTRTAFIKYEVEDYEINEQQFHSNMVLPGISYARKRTLGGTTPFWGEQWLFSSEFASDELSSDVTLLKFQLLGQRLRTYFDRHMFISRINVGAIITDEINDVPISMRFFAGGDKSVRGYRYESIGPKLKDQVVGGQYLATATAEYNYHILPNWRAAVFVDAGTATNDFEDAIQVGVGVGARWLTAIGPVRIDYAFAVTDDSRMGRFSITIGPEI